MEKETKTPEQITAEKAAKEEFDLQKGILNNEFIKNIALSNYLGHTEEYGKFGKDVADSTYLMTAGKAPDQMAYNALFGEAVLGNGSITKEQLKVNAMKYWGGAVASQTINDLSKSMGYSGEINSEISGHKLSELGEENAKLISSMYMKHQSTGLLKQGLEMQSEGIKKSLESMLAPKKEESTEAKK